MMSSGHHVWKSQREGPDRLTRYFRVRQTRGPLDWDDSQAINAGRQERKTEERTECLVWDSIAGDSQICKFHWTLRGQTLIFEKSGMGKKSAHTLS